MRHYLIKYAQHLHTFSEHNSKNWIKISFSWHIIVKGFYRKNLGYLFLSLHKSENTINNTILYNTYVLRLFYQNYFFPTISTSVALIYTKLSSFIPIYILKVVTEGFIYISFIAWFIQHVIPENMVKIVFFMAVSIFWFLI